MNNFTFPPPPPPPPKAAPGFSQEYNAPLQYDNRRGGGRGDFRGRGRGDHQRGRLRGGPSGQFQAKSQDSYNGNPNFLQQNGHQYQSPQQGMNGPLHPNGSLSSPYESPLASMSYAYPPSNLSQMGMFAAPGSYNVGQYGWLGPNAYNQQQWSQNQPTSVPVQQNHEQSPLTNGADSSNYRYAAANATSSNSFRGQKRKFGEWNDARRTHVRPKSEFQNNPKVPVAPAVPSFGAPLPFAKPPPSICNATVISAEQKRKKPRKTNQLGLTPSGEDYEETEEEVDEEALFAVKGAPLQIEYNGKTSVLGSAADIAAWLEERRKRWPTKARVEEKQKELAKRKEEQAEARRKVQESRAHEQSKRKQEAEERQKLKQALSEQGREEPQPRVNQIKKDPQESFKQNSAERMKRSLEKHLAKAEKLRKKLEKSKAKLAKLANKSADGGSVLDNTVIEDGNSAAASSEQILAATTRREADPASQQLEETPAVITTTSPLDLLLGDLDKTVGIQEIPMQKLDDDSDASSSSGSSASTSDSDSDVDGESLSAPDETSSKSNGPVRVAPPKRQVSKVICRNFLAKGHCGAGDRCRFLHVLPERGQRQREKVQQPKREQRSARKERKTLFQRLVEQEQAEENRLALQAIKHLGEHGLLDEK